MNRFDFYVTPSSFLDERLIQITLSYRFYSFIGRGNEKVTVKVKLAVITNYRSAFNALNSTNLATNYNVDF